MNKQPSIQDLQLTSSRNDTLKTIFHNDKVRYQRKGFGLVFAALISLTFLYFGPKILKFYWLDIFGENHLRSYHIISIFYSPFVALVVNLCYWFIYTSKLEIFERYRVYPNKKWPWEEDPVKWKKTFRNAMKVILINYFIVPIPYNLLNYVKGPECRFDIESFPGFFEVCYQLLFMMIIEDIGFYSLHRLLHHPKLYKFHKIHHEFNNTISIAYIYSHPLEHFTSGIFPSILGFAILGPKAHYSVFILWMIVRTAESVDGHCGYEFSWSPFRLIPFSGSSEYHNFHHSHNEGVYSSFFTYLDTIFGTNKEYFKFKAKKEQEEKSKLKVKCK